MPPAILRERFEALRQGGYQVLSLGEAVERLYKNDLPPRSVALTFDDGGYDFYRQANPILREFGYPATVYQSTYYSDYTWPIFGVAASYLFWKRRDGLLQPSPALGLRERLDLRSEAGLLVLEVVDDGVGRPAIQSPGSGHGLLGMRERAAMLGGELTAGPQLGGGWRVAARLPLGEPQ